MKRRIHATLVALATLLPGALLAASAHRHGVVQLDAVIDGPLLTVSVSLPLDSLLGYERAPRTATEKQAAQRLIDRLRNDESLVRPDAAAGCTAAARTLVAPALGLGPGGGEGEHADIEVTFGFRCKEPARLGSVDLGLVAAYPRITRVEAQLVGVKGQARQVLMRPVQRLIWPQ